jgi:hypothetical protein
MFDLLAGFRLRERMKLASAARVLGRPRARRVRWPFCFLRGVRHTQSLS